MTRILRHLAMLLICFGIGLATGMSAQASPKEAQELVDKSKFVLERLLQNPDFGRLKANLTDAKGVLILPSVLKAGFIVGAEGGSGVLLSRDRNGEWSYPAFYSLGAGSIGLQFGFQDSEIVLLIMTYEGLNAVLDNNLKLGLDASVAIGPVGQGIEGSTTTGLGADITAFSNNRGLFGGGALEGAVIYERESLNTAYYKVGASARAIVMDREFINPAADNLRSVLAVQ